MAAVKERGKRTRRVYGQKTRQKRSIQPKMNRLLIQTIVSALLFLIVFVGRGVIPTQAVDVFHAVNQMIHSESLLLNDVQALGIALIEGENWQEALAEVFLPTSEQTKNSFPLIGLEYHVHLHPQIQID